MLNGYDRPHHEQVAALFHSIYGTEFQMYKVNVTREEIQNLIGMSRNISLICSVL